MLKKRLEYLLKYIESSQSISEFETMRLDEDDALSEKYPYYVTARILLRAYRILKNTKKLREEPLTTSSIIIGNKLMSGLKLIQTSGSRSRYSTPS
ncbi:MAG: hypothetical protein QXI11_04670 [Thermoproteota archaeon]